MARTPVPTPDAAYPSGTFQRMPERVRVGKDEYRLTGRVFTFDQYGHRVDPVTFTRIEGVEVAR